MLQKFNAGQDVLVISKIDFAFSLVKDLLNSEHDEIRNKLYANDNLKFYTNFDEFHTDLLCVNSCADDLDTLNDTIFEYTCVDKVWFMKIHAYSGKLHADLDVVLTECA